MDLPVDPGMSPERLRRTLLQIGDEAGWWDYQSQNPSGYVDNMGREYAETSYTLLVPPPQGAEGSDDQGELTVRVLLAGEVLGYVLASADRYPGGVELIAYRQSLLPE